MKRTPRKYTRPLPPFATRVIDALKSRDLMVWTGIVERGWKDLARYSNIDARVLRVVNLAQGLGPGDFPALLARVHKVDPPMADVLQRFYDKARDDYGFSYPNDRIFIEVLNELAT